jgi:ribonuclease BN (tRNA processing enzyme)
LSEVLFVGTSDAFGAGGRRQSAILVRGESGTLLLDCGTTTASGLSELAIDRNEVEAIAVSHFHADHFGGIPIFLLAAQYLDERTTPLWVAGPPGVELRVRQLAEAMGHPIKEDLPFALHFQELPALPGTEGALHSVGPAQVRAFETKHQVEAHPHGYAIDLGGQRIAYSGDTGWFDELPSHVAGADLFICECTQHRKELDFHLSLEEITEHRAEFDCGKLILTHLGAEMLAQRGECEFDIADDGLLVKL